MVRDVVQIRLGARLPVPGPASPRRPAPSPWVAEGGGPTCPESPSAKVMDATGNA